MFLVVPQEMTLGQELVRGVVKGKEGQLYGDGRRRH